MAFTIERTGSAREVHRHGRPFSIGSHDEGTTDLPDGSSFEKAVQPPDKNISLYAY
jgi:hypothetical protein